MAFDASDRRLAGALMDTIRDRTKDPGGGVSRASYSAAESVAWTEISEAAAQNGLHTATDSAANLVMLLSDAWPVPEAKVVGSHLDSVPRGGNYDGLAGVVAALLILLRAKREGSRVPLVGLGLRGEESAWFGTPHIGAKAIFGKLTPEDLDRTDKSEPRPNTLHSRLAQCGAAVRLIRAGERLWPTYAVREYWELHIEQGPVLVEADVPVGIVTAIRGSVRAADARVLGKAGHSGTTPHNLRKDAVLIFSQLLVGLERERARLESEGEDIVLTCGIVGTVPAKHGLTTISDEVRFTLDVRSTNPKTIDYMYSCARMHGGDNLVLGNLVASPGIRVADDLVACGMRAARDLGIPWISLPSGAGHDATVFHQAGIPAGMIFVRNQNGSHNPDEAMDIDDFMQGVEVLYRVLHS